MFYHQRQHYHAHGFLFILSLIAAFMLGRKSEQYGYTIISRGCDCSHMDDEGELEPMNDLSPNNSYPR